MPKVVKIRKGLNIPLKGKAEKILAQGTVTSGLFGLKPTDFISVEPKLLKKEGEKVLAGEPVFFSKSNPKIQFCSSVSGTVKSILRGERRKLLEIIIEASEQQEYVQYRAGKPSELDRVQIIEQMLQSGVWPMVLQRPFDVIANPLDIPKAIFVSAFDSAPLAPDYDFVLQGEDDNFQTGIDVLRKLSGGLVHLNVNGQFPVAKIFSGAKGVELNTFNGPHPAGNVGVQIHHIDPVNKGEVVWYVNPQDLVIIGRLFNKGIYDASRIIALAGSEVLKPHYYRVKSGIHIQSVTNNNVTKGQLRYISGNVLTGTKVSAGGFLSYYSNQITVIPENVEPEFMGWIAPGINKFSVSRTFFSWLMPGKEYSMSANIQGGERPFVFSGEYERVLPMDIYPVHLLKAILVQDIDQMEALGIYEIGKEDFALCEFVCTSKIEVQKILQEGIDLMVKELS